jgi:uncharacterized protein
MSSSALQEKETRLSRILSGLGSSIVAYSGGVDSSLLAYYAKRILKDDARIVIAVSPSLAEEELLAARLQAEQFHFDLIEIKTSEVEDPDYQRNDEMRCYFCKKTLFQDLEAMAEREGVAHIAYGANLDDRRDFRPGHKAAREFGVISPLQDAGLTKEEIRQLAKQAGLPSHDRPQAACLSSRFPTFQPVTIEALSQVDKAEQFLHSLGFRQVRVRHHDQIARIELEQSELPTLSGNPELMGRVVEHLRGLGYKFVTLDMEGYRQGSANTFVSAGAKPTHAVDQNG